MKHGLCIFLAAVLILSGLSSCGIFKGREEGAEVIRTSRETDEQTSPETETTQEETTPEETETEPRTERSSEESSTEETTEAETTEEESSEEPTEEESTDPDDNSESTSDAGEYSRALAKKNQEFNSEDAEITAELNGPEMDIVWKNGSGTASLRLDFEKETYQIQIDEN